MQGFKVPGVGDHEAIAGEFGRDALGGKALLAFDLEGGPLLGNEGAAIRGAFDKACEFEGVGGGDEEDAVEAGAPGLGACVFCREDQGGFDDGDGVGGGLGERAELAFLFGEHSGVDEGV